MTKRVYIVLGLVALLLLPGAFQTVSAQETEQDSTEQHPMNTEAHIAVFGRDVVQQWASLSGRGGRTPEVDSLITEGERYLFMAEQFVEQVGYEALSEQQRRGNLRLLQLRNSFLDVMKWLEVERSRDFNLSQLRELEQRYVRERDLLMQQMAEKRSQLIDASRRFLNTVNQNPDIQRLSERDRAELIADVEFRLADLYVREADEEFSRQWEDYDRQYYAWLDAGGTGSEPRAPQMDYSKSLRLYQDVVDNFSNTSLYSQALYNVAFIMDESNEPSLKRRAQSKFETIADNYRDSEYADESLYRLGMYQFEVDSNMTAAIPYFERVLEYRGSKYYSSSLYMLGWCYFRKDAVADAGLTDKPNSLWSLEDFALLQATKDKNYDIAVQYFDDAVKYSREQKKMFGKAAPIEAIAMESEAIEYLATCFTLDYPEMEWTDAGIDNAVSFLHVEDWRYREYGYKLLEQMGKLYQEEILMDTLAILAWEAAIDQYPLEPPNPELQQKIINIYWFKMHEPQAAYVARQYLFDRYRRGTAWDSVNNETAYRPWADSLIANEYYFNYTMTMDTLFNQRQNEAIESALLVATNYLTEFPFSERTPKVEFQLASVLSQPRYSDNLQFQVNAYWAYRDVLVMWADHPKNTYREQATVGMLRVAQALMEAEKNGMEIPPRTFELPEKRGGQVKGGSKPAPQQVTPGPQSAAGSMGDPVEDDMDVVDDLEETPDANPPTEAPVSDETEADVQEEEREDLQADEAELEGGAGGAEDADTGAGLETEEPESEILPDTGSALVEPESDMPVDEQPVKEPAAEPDTAGATAVEPDTSTGEQPSEEEPGLPVMNDTTNVDDGGVWDDEEEFPEEIAPAEEDTTDNSQGMGWLNDVFAGMVDMTPADWDPFLYAMASTERVTWAMQQDPDTTQQEEDPFEEEPIFEDDAPAGEEPEQEEEPVAIPPTGATPPATMEEPAVEPVSAEEDSAMMAVADSAAQEEKKYEPIPLTTAESMFMEPVDSLVQSWPENEFTQDMVMIAAQTYYRKNHYQQSRHYYRIIIDRFFNNIDYRNIAYRAIINGYAREKNFEKVEEVALEIERVGIGGELSEEANMMAGKAIYEASEAARASGDFNTAAMEFRRVALDRPNYASADDALWESGLTFTQAKNWDEAITSFRLLAHTYPDSQWADQAFYNIASIYGDANQKPDKANAAATWDSLATLYPKSDFANVAVSEASRLYDEMESWEKALRMNEMYIDLFPEDTLAFHFLFEQARLNLKLDREANAMRIYEDFAQKYPDDPRTVKAHLDRGEFYLDQRSDTTRAREAFESCLVANERIKEVQARKGENAIGFPEAASKAKNYLTQWKFREFLAIRYTGTPGQIETKKEQKEALRLDLIDDYNELLSYLQDEAFKAHFRIPQMAEQIALAEQSIQREAAFDPEGKLEIDEANAIYSQEETIANDAISIMLGAVEMYEEGLDSLRSLMSNMRTIRTETQATVDSLTEFLAQAQRDILTLEGDEKAALEDEVKQSQQRRQDLSENIDKFTRRIDIAQQWSDSIRVRIPTVIEKCAEIYSVVPGVLWTIEPVGDYDWAKMIMQKAIFEDLVVPAEILAMDWHMRAAQTADTSKALTDGRLNEEFRAMADSARQQIMVRADKLYDAYQEAVTWAKERGYERYRARMLRLIDIDLRTDYSMGMGYVEDRWGYFLNMYPAEIANYQYQIAELGASYMTMSRKVLAEMQLDDKGWDTYYDPYADKLMSKAVEMIAMVDSLQQADVAMKHRYAELSVEHMDTLNAYVVAQAGFAELEFNWTVLDSAMPEEAWKIPSEIYVQNEPYAEEIGRWLVRLDPAKWGHLAGIGESTNYLISDTTWYAADWIWPEDPYFYYDPPAYKKPMYSTMPDPIQSLDYIKGPPPNVIALYETEMRLETRWVLEPDPNYVPPAPDSLRVDSLQSDSTLMDTTAGDSIGGVFTDDDTTGSIFDDDAQLADTAAVGDSTLLADVVSDSFLVDTTGVDSTLSDSAGFDEHANPPEGKLWVEKTDTFEVKVPYPEMYYLINLKPEDRISAASLNITAFQNWFLWINNQMIDENSWDSTAGRWQYYANYPVFNLLNPEPGSDNIIIVGVLNGDTTNTVGGLWFTMEYNTVKELTEEMSITLPEKPADYNPSATEGTKDDSGGNPPVPDPIPVQQDSTQQDPTQFFTE